MKLLSLALNLTVVLLGSSSSFAKVRPASLLQEGMVIQRQMPVPIWGTADAGEDVTVTFAGQEKKTQADSSGHWLLRLDALADSAQGREMIIAGENRVVIKDVVVGEVWICSGQSNMQFSAKSVPETKNLLSQTKQIRTFTVERTVAFEEQEFCQGEWKNSPPDSAVALSFAHLLQQAADLPVGIILTCWGSSSLEAWMPRDMTKTAPHFATIIEEFDADQKTRAALQASLDGPKPWPKKEDIFMRRQPNILYNAMMKPLAPFACRGLVWYQGERNTQSMHGMPASPWFHRNSGMLLYGQILTKWIERYRLEWEQPEMEFMIVMLPRYGATLKTGPRTGDRNPASHSWAWMRESQLQALNLPHTSVINTIDLGDRKNVHPKDKYPIGQRLALVAAKNTLGQEVEANGPTMTKVEKRGKELIVHFQHGHGLTTTDGQAPSAFWITDKSQKWVPAQAKLTGETITLSSAQIPAPKYVRYAFAGFPEVNLINAAKLPAVPFRNDTFPPGE